MPTILNVSGGDRNLPELGLSVAADASVEVSDETAERLEGHPDFDVVVSARPGGVAASTEATITEPAPAAPAPQEV